MNSQEETLPQILAIERTAMERWANGDPDGFLALLAPDVSYFDPFIPSSIDGAEALTAYYNQMRGKVHLDHFEFIEPRIQVCGSLAILTFQFVSQTGDIHKHWNTTEVYRNSAVGWQIIHTHWSFHQPKLAN
jgi:ketosteroid isomerase-like protein